jgi:hypothetical protein
MQARIVRTDSSSPTRKEREGDRMSSPLVEHPADRLLIGFNLGALDDSNAVTVNRHLKGCPKCRLRLLTLSDEPAMPGLSQEKLAAGSGLEAVAAAAHADWKVSWPKARPSSLRRPKSVWTFAAAGTLLLGLAVAWGVGAFSSKTAIPKTAEVNSAPSVQSPSRDAAVEPKRIQPEPARQETTQSNATAASPSSAAAAPANSKPEVAAVPEKEAPKVDESLKPDSSGLGSSGAAADPTAEIARSREKQLENAKQSSADFFNGKDLSHWQGATDVWHVDNGSIVGNFPAGQTQSPFLYSQQKYKDFDLRFQANIDGGIGGCAVQIRSQVTDGEKPQVIGAACAIYGNDPPHDRRTGCLIIEPQSKVEKMAPTKLVERFVKPGENHFHIRCQGKHILFEVNGIKTVNADFLTLPDEGVIAWKLDGKRAPHRVTFKKIKFTDLTGVPSRSQPEHPSLANADLLKAEIKFETTIKKADEALLNQFDLMITKLQHSRHPIEKELVGVVDHEKELFKEKGLIPWSRPMRKAFFQYGKELREARRAVGLAFDSAMDRAEKNHDEKRKEALLEEASQVLAPRELAAWEPKDPNSARFVFYSDGTLGMGNQQDETSSRFWELQPQQIDIIVLEFPDGKNPTATMERAFLLAIDGKTMTTTAPNGAKKFWQHAEEAVTTDGA